MRIKRRINGTESAKMVGIGIVGKIAIGEKAKGTNGKEYPVSLDYFKCRANQEYMAMFTEKFGEKPDKLTITFLSNETSEVCPNYYELRDGAGKRLAYGDGITFLLATKQGDGTVKDVSVTPQNPDKWMIDAAKSVGQEWKEVLILRFALPQMPVMGIWEIRTSGDDSSIPAILGTIDAVNSIAGRICMIPFDLSVKKVKSDKAGSKSVYPVISLTCNLSQESAERVSQLPTGVYTMLTEQKVLQLTSGEDAPTSSLSPGGNDPDFAHYEFVEEISDVDQKNYIDSLKLDTVEDYTAAAYWIADIRDEKLRSEYVSQLADKAQLAGYFWSKSEKKYIQ
jgi:hypothetical protein